MPGTTNWPGYLRDYHASHAGITEQLLRGCAPDPYAWLLEGVPIAGRRVLDLACGSAPVFPHLADSGYLGIDASTAELRAAAARERGPLLRADATQLPLPTSSIEVVICSMALQILTPLPAVLTELARILTPDGLLVAMLPVSAPLTPPDRLRYSQLLWRLRRPRLGYANPHVPRTLAHAGWTVHQQPARRFGYQIATAADGRCLVDAFYLPTTSDGRYAAAAALAASWAGVEVGIPLQRLVATPPPPRHRTQPTTGSRPRGLAQRPHRAAREASPRRAGSLTMSDLPPNPTTATTGPGLPSDVGSAGVPNLRIYSTTWCGSCIRLKRQLNREGVAYDEIDVDRYDDAAAFVMRVNGGNRTVPTVQFPDGSTLADPSVRDVLRRLGA